MGHQAPADSKAMLAGPTARCTAPLRAELSFNYQTESSCVLRKSWLGGWVSNRSINSPRGVPRISEMTVGIGPELTDANSDTPSIGIGRCSPC
jgi:hypothetical protein